MTVRGSASLKATFKFFEPLQKYCLLTKIGVIFVRAHPYVISLIRFVICFPMKLNVMALTATASMLTTKEVSCLLGMVKTVMMS